MYLLFCWIYGTVWELTPDLERVKATLQHMLDEGDNDFDRLVLYAVKPIPLKGRTLGKIPPIPNGMIATYFRVFPANEVVRRYPDVSTMTKSIKREPKTEVDLGTVWVGVPVAIRTRVEVANEIIDHQATRWVGSPAKTTRRKKA